MTLQAPAPEPVQSGPHRRLWESTSCRRTEYILLWDEFFANYHVFLCFLDPDKDKPDDVFEKSEFLFWTTSS